MGKIMDYSETPITFLLACCDKYHLLFEQYEPILFHLKLYY